MIPNKNHLKVAHDITFMQSAWSFIFFIILLINQGFKYFLFSLGKNSGEFGTFYNLAFSGSTIFMLIIGIISAYSFLPLYVNHGVTRKDYFRGNAIAIFYTSIVLIVVSLLIAGIEQLVVNMLDLNVTFINEGATEDEDNIIASLVLTTIGSKFADFSQVSVVLSFIVFFIRAAFYYMIGWLIGVSFYHSGVISGLGSIALSILFVSLFDLFLEVNEGNLFRTYLSIDFQSPNDFVTILISFLLMGIILYLIRSITRRITIKL